MSYDLIDLDLRLLLIRYGKRRVLERLNHITDQEPEEVGAEIQKLERRSSSSPRKLVKTTEQLVELLGVTDPERLKLLRSIAQRFDSKSFLPTLRNAEQFLGRYKIDHGVIRSRKDAGAIIVRQLAQLPKDALNDLLRDVDSGDGKSEYYQLAHQILGRGSK